MHKHELTHEERVRILAGAVRNNMVASTIFTPYHGLDLAWQAGQLCRTSVHVGHFDRVFEPIASMEEIMEMSDEEIYQRVEGQ